MSGIGETIKIDPPEKYRKYYFAGNTEVILESVCELVVRPSGTHRIKTKDGLLHIVPTGWVHIEIDAVDWTL